MLDRYFVIPKVARPREPRHDQSVRRNHTAIQRSSSKSLRIQGRSGQRPRKNSLAGRRETPQLARFTLTVMCPESTRHSLSTGRLKTGYLEAPQMRPVNMM